jgi:hypothetical protein
MEYIKKIVAAWEKQYGQIMFSGSEYITAKDIFKDFIGRSFLLDTFKGSFKNVNFLDYPIKRNLRIPCSKFFKQLSKDDEIFLFIKDKDTIKIQNEIPDDDTKTLSLKADSEKELLEIIAKLTRENLKLRETNADLFEYKDRLDKYENMQKIFKDEKTMEDWLENNIHVAVPDLDVIDRQYIIKWDDGHFNKIDLLCVDRTTRELVIVENKIAGRDKTVITQYAKYRAWAKHHLDELNEKYKDKNLKATENLRVVIITDKIDESLEITCKDENIPLIYIDGGVIFEEIVPYNNF